MRWFQDITLGNYYPADSVVHRLDPRLKMTAMALLMGMTFAVSNPWAILLQSLAIIAAVRLSRIPMTYFLRSLRFFVWLFFFTAVLHLFFTPGEPVPGSPFLGFIRVTYEGIAGGGLISWRLITVIALSSIFTSTTTPLEITRGMESILSPLGKLHFPVQDFSLMMMMAIRFIPVLSDETQKIWKAQKSRGADLGHGGIKRRTRALVSILLPVFVGIFRRADDLAKALEARGYVPGKRRTSMKELIWTGRESMALIIILILSFSLLILQSL